MASEYESWIRDEVAEWPGAAVTFEKSSKHRKAIISFGEGVRFVIFPDTPSDNGRGVYNCLSDVRRELKALGAARTERLKSSRKSSERNPGADMRVTIGGELAAERPDPWEAIRHLADQPLITAAGAYPNIDTADYHRNANLLPGPSISASGLKTITAKSPRHYWFDSPLNPNRPEESEKPHFAIGKAAHDMLLLTDRWPEHYHVLPEGFNPNATKAQAEAHAEREEARKTGKVILKHEEAQTVRACCASLKANSFAAAALTNGEPEVTLAWQDEETGVWLRCRPDFLPHKRQIIPDLKTAADGSQEGFRRAIGNNGYHQAAALYMDGIKAIYGAYPKHWLHVVMEKEPPHVVALYELPAEDIQRGRWLNRKAIRLFADCLSADRWPGYSDDVTQLGLPQWARKTIDEDTTLTDAAWAAAA